MERTIRVSMFSTAAILAAGVAVSFITSTIVVSRAISHRTKLQEQSKRDITVKGSARMRVKSDTTVWEITIPGEAKTLPEAYEVLDAGMAKVTEFLDRRGFGKAETAISAIDTSTYYVRNEKGVESREVASYRLTRSVTVTSVRCDEVLLAASDITSLIRDGVPVSSSSPKFYYSRLADLKVQILGEASKDARTRADEIIRNTGGKIGAVRDAQMGILQITTPNSTEVSSYGIYDTSTIEKDVTAVVTVTFGIES